MNTTPNTNDTQTQAWLDSLVERRMKQSHKRQFNGEDWQAVASGLTDDVPESLREEAFAALSSSPDPGCECGFCATADWQD